MKIFIITPVFPNSINKASGLFVFQQAKILKEMGHEVYVLDAGEYSYKNWIDKSLYSIQNYHIDNIKVIAKHTHGLMRTKLPRIYIKLYYSNLKKIFDFAIKKLGNPDLLFAHFSFPSGYCACNLAKAHNLPCIILEHGSLFLTKTNEYINNILNYTVDNSYMFYSVSPSLTRAINDKLIKKRNISIMNNVLTDKYTYQFKPKNKCFVFFSAGNFYKDKGFVELINAFKKAFTDNENIKLNIAGSGPEENSILKAIDDDKRINLLGVLNTDEMIKEYARCDAFVLASRVETFGMVYREALAIGRPVIAIENDGVKYLWNSDYGYIAKNNEELSKYLKLMYNNNDNFNGKIISEKVLSDFGKGRFINEWRNIENRIKG